MSDELRLPDDLAAMEARLAAHAPPTSGLNRDALMYRAGWAACEAQRSAPASVSQATRSTLRRWTTVGWSFSSAALAASLAVALTLKMAPQQRSVDRVAERPAPSEQMAAVGPSSAEVNNAAAAKTTLTSLVLPRRYSAAASLLMARDQVIQRQWSDLPIYPAVGGVAARNGSAAAEKTSRQLLDELAPQRRLKGHDESPRRMFDWPWSATTEGERI